MKEQKPPPGGGRVSGEKKGQKWTPEKEKKKEASPLPPGWPAFFFYPLFAFGERRGGEKTNCPRNKGEREL